MVEIIDPIRLPKLDRLVHGGRLVDQQGRRTRDASLGLDLRVGHVFQRTGAARATRWPPRAPCLPSTRSRDRPSWRRPVWPRPWTAISGTSRAPRRFKAPRLLISSWALICSISATRTVGVIWRITVGRNAVRDTVLDDGLGLVGRAVGGCQTAQCVQAAVGGRVVLEEDLLSPLGPVARATRRRAASWPYGRSARYRRTNRRRPRVPAGNA